MQLSSALNANDRVGFIPTVWMTILTVIWHVGYSLLGIRELKEITFWLLMLQLVCLGVYIGLPQYSEIAFHFFLLGICGAALRGAMLSGGHQSGMLAAFLVIPFIAGDGRWHFLF